MIKLINKILSLFKKEDYIPDDLGAKFYWPMEVDPRDFKADQVLKAPTDEELNTVPKEFNILSKAWDKLIPVNQGCVPSCTMSSLTNYITLQEVIEQNLQDEIAWQKWAEINREKMGHKWICKWERWDYLENALKITKANWLLAEFTNKWIKDKYIKIDSYSFFKANISNIKYWISQWYPMYYAFSWNRNTWIEISRWEIKTAKFSATGGHCVTAVWYDDTYLYFINTWRPNDWDQYVWDYSVFKIKWTVLNEMLKYWLANWRWWIVNVEKNLPDKPKQMFKDYKIDINTEAGKAILYLSNKWMIKGIDKADWKYLEPNAPVTRLQIILIIYRVLMFIGRA